MNVFKFGGASICSADAVRNLYQIICTQGEQPLVVVVSAMGKTTNALEKLLSLQQENQSLDEAFTAVTSFHLDIASSLFEDPAHGVFNQIEELFTLLKQNLAKDFSNSDRAYDQTVSIGELLSSTIVHAYLEMRNIACEFLDARELILTDSYYREGNVNWKKTRAAIKNRIPNDKPLLYLTQGFIGSDSHGNTVTLGREGSDYSAAIFGSCLQARSVTFWKNVPGILNADPSRWEKTVQYHSLSYAEAAEMTYYGAKVIHPKTIKPLAVDKIPLLVKSFLDPTLDGTLIGDLVHEVLEPALIVKSNQCLISFQVQDFSFINEQKLSIIFHLFEEYHIRMNMMQCSAISFSVCIDSPDKKMKLLIDSLSGEFDVFYNDHLELITIKNYRPELIEEIKQGKQILLEQKSRKNYQMLTTVSAENTPC